MFYSSDNKVKHCFNLMHYDLWGPYRVLASCGANYFFTTVDDCSRAVWIYLLKGKHEVAYVLKNSISMIKRQFEKDVKTITSDNDNGFVFERKFL